VIETAKPILFEPFAEDVPGQRLPPAALCPHPAPHRRGGKQNARRRERKEYLRLEPKRLRVPAFESVEETPVPQVQQHLQQQLQEDNSSEEKRENPRGGPVLPPEPRSRLPEARQELLLVETRSNPT
jgi:hypothetical protein